MLLLHDDFYFVDQNGEKSSDYYIFFEEYPQIKLGQEQKEKKTIPGRGNVWIQTGTYSDTEISMILDVNVTGENVNHMQAYAKAHLLLSNIKKISFSDSLNFFFKVKDTSVGGRKPYADTAGDFSVALSCEAGLYLKNGENEFEVSDVLLNPYSISHPIYKITGDGKCTLTVNGNKMDANVGQNLTIDTDLMIAYRQDGTMLNASVSGDYEGLYLKNGANTIGVSSGFEIKVIPNWRYLP